MFFGEATEYRQLRDAVETRDGSIFVHGLTDEALAHVLEGLARDVERNVVIVTTTESEAKELEAALHHAGVPVLYLPKKEIVFFKAIAHSHHQEIERLRTIDRLIAPGRKILVLSIETLATKMLPPALYDQMRMTLSLADEHDLDALREKLLRLGYRETDLVAFPGEFAIRGGIVDLYSPTAEAGYRIEFFGDEVDGIRLFDVDSQISSESLETIDITPGREVLLPPSEVEGFLERLEAARGEVDAVERLEEKLEAVRADAASGLIEEELDTYLPLLDHLTTSPLAYLQDPLLVLKDYNRQMERLSAILRDFEHRFTDYLERGEVLPAQFGLYEDELAIHDSVGSRQRLFVDRILKDVSGHRFDRVVGFKTQEAPVYFGKMEALAQDLAHYKKRGYRVILCLDSEEKIHRLSLALLTDYDLSTRPFGGPGTDVAPGEIVLYKEDQPRGYLMNTVKLLVLTDRELFGQHKEKRPTKTKKAGYIRHYSELEVGDLVVHEHQGIGRYVGVTQLTVDKTQRDYVKIEYRDEGYLYIPVENLDLIQKYIGDESGRVKLNKLGGREWQKAKAKVRSAIEDMTDELLTLYAEREKKPGFAFSADGPWQGQFEDLFPYEETPDQLKCLSEIKRDMEKARPMDRLLCGDVGYGKTEVAIRAIFKAVLDSKQVAFLVPTTILAQQHMLTLQERFSSFPARVEVLSRFKTPAEQKKILEDARKGLVDVVVGTHRLLSKDVTFKDLGLLVVDEEQRFGVRDKERIKQMRTEVDVLTLTATPIPRTLHMSLIGIRDMSLIEDPPEDRYPIQTYVIAYDEVLLREAIEREIDRGGQVFFVHNRVSDIDRVTAKIQALVPDAKVRYAHGQMNEHKLERVMMDFLEKSFDVLVCTTIIETGLDISNVNTIIIDEGHRFGLSQLYQLRGRVGRSNRMAYAYITYPREHLLTEVAEKRLGAIKEFTELGSGFKIAMRDLEIRGAGNLLGQEQSGHMSAIGYDLYVKMLEEAVAEIKGEKVQRRLETKVDLPLDAYLPDTYTTNESIKLEMYKRIAAIESDGDADDMLAELIDRFGDPPDAVVNLVSIAHLKALFNRISAERVTVKGRDLVVTFHEEPDLHPATIAGAMNRYGERFRFTAVGQPEMKYQLKRYPPRDTAEILTFAKTLIAFGEEAEEKTTANNKE